MFSHRQLTDQLQFEILTDDAGNKLSVVPARGGIISSLELAGKSILYLDNATLLDQSKNVRGGNPILFPICGPVANNHYQIDGQTYQMKQHGFARNLPWQVTDVQTGEHASLSISLTSNELTREQYPFDFRVDFTYLLLPDRLMIEQHYQNLSNARLPFYAGFHPYFNAPAKQHVSLQINAEQFQDFISGTTHELASPIDFDAAAETNGAFVNVSGGQVQFDNFGCDYALELSFSEPFRHVVIWALRDKPFICVEPWMGLNNSMNLGESVVLLDSGEKLSTSVTYRAIPID